MDINRYKHDVDGDFLLENEHEKPATGRLQRDQHKKAPTEKGFTF